MAKMIGDTIMPMIAIIKAKSKNKTFSHHLLNTGISIGYFFKIVSM
tara:strand:- start:176 stop:313 length:138 start_codon:yes stop_codon:yes gene_type:complete